MKLSKMAKKTAFAATGLAAAMLVGWSIGSAFGENDARAAVEADAPFAVHSDVHSVRELFPGSR